MHGDHDKAPMEKRAHRQYFPASRRTAPSSPITLRWRALTSCFSTLTRMATPKRRSATTLRERSGWSSSRSGGLPRGDTMLLFASRGQLGRIQRRHRSPRWGRRQVGRNFGP